MSIERAEQGDGVPAVQAPDGSVWWLRNQLRRLRCSWCGRYFGALRRSPCPWHTAHPGVWHTNRCDWWWPTARVVMRERREWENRARATTVEHGSNGPELS